MRESGEEAPRLGAWPLEQRCAWCSGPPMEFLRSLDLVTPWSWGATTCVVWHTHVHLMTVCLGQHGMVCECE